MFLNTIYQLKPRYQDIIKAISTCGGYLTASAATFVAFHKMLVARIEEEDFVMRDF